MSPVTSRAEPTLSVGFPNGRGAQANFIILTLLLLDLWHEGGSAAWSSGLESYLSGSEDSTEPMDNSQTAILLLIMILKMLSEKIGLVNLIFCLNLWIPDFLQNFSRKFVLSGEMFSAFKEILKIL